jgi:hypothetical protein
MFDNVLVGIRVGHRDAGRNALALARELVSSDGKLMLVYINVVAPKPAPDSGAMADAATRRYALAELTALGVGYDGSAGSEQALAVARKLAAERGATLSASQVIPPPLHVRDGWSAEREVEARVTEAKERIAALGGVEPRAESAGGVLSSKDERETIVDAVHARSGERRVRRRPALVDGWTSPWSSTGVIRSSGASDDRPNHPKRVMTAHLLGQQACGQP